MISRTFDQSYSAAWLNPPPLHTYSPAYEAANWHPVPPVPEAMRGQHPGPVMVMIPAMGGNMLGDDPTDPRRQTRPRIATTGCIGRFHEKQRGES